MRFLGLTALAMIMLAACGGAPAAGRDPVSTVEAIYAPYVADAANPPALATAAPWTEDLAVLIAAAGEVEGGIGFDPIIDGQEYDVSDLQVTAADETASAGAVVSAAFMNLGDPVTVTYDLVQVGGGWRVHDVRTEVWTLRGSLASAGVTPERVAEQDAK